MNTLSTSDDGYEKRVTMSSQAKSDVGQLWRKANKGVWFDRESGRVGFGRKYGEHSYNNRPIRGQVVGDTVPKKTPFGPLDSPKPKDR